MTVINPNSISGITSITLPAGADNVLTIHTNDGVERFRIDSSGNIKVGSAATISPDGDVFFTGVCTATTLAGSGANLTSLPSAQLSGALPALDGSALTGVASTENIRTNTNATFLQNINVSGITTVGSAVTISESGIEASGIGITCANINGGQISGRRNLAINGAFIISQRGTSSTASSGYNTVDRWSQDFGGCDESPTFSTFGVSAPSSPYHLPTSGAHPYKEGFRTAWGVTNGNQTSGAGADDNIIMGYAFEGQDIVNSGWDYLSSSSYVTLSFWIKSSVSQEFFGQLLAPTSTAYNYPFGTGSLTAHTWKKVIKKIPGNSNITIPNSNAAGLRFYLWPFAGTNLTGSVTNDAWQANNYSTRVSDNTTTWYLTNDASVQITGFQLEVGSQATPFEHRSTGEELHLCQRYYETTYDYHHLNAQNGESDRWIRFKVSKRASHANFNIEWTADAEL